MDKSQSVRKVDRTYKGRKNTEVSLSGRQSSKESNSPSKPAEEHLHCALLPGALCSVDSSSATIAASSPASSSAAPEATSLLVGEASQVAAVFSTGRVIDLPGIPLWSC